MLDLSFALTPEEHEHKTNGYRTEEGEEAHRRGDYERFGVERVRLGHLGGRVGSLRELRGLDPRFVHENRYASVPWDSFDVESHREAVVSGCVPGQALVGAAVLHLGVANFQGTVWQDADPPRVGEDVLVRRDPGYGGGRVAVSFAREKDVGALFHSRFLRSAI